jgi:hypothetical protein
LTTNRKLEIVAGLGGIVVGLATGGVLPAAAGAIGAAVASLAMLFREKPEKHAAKLKRAKAIVAADARGQVADAEEPKR